MFMKRYSIMSYSEGYRGLEAPAPQSPIVLDTVDTHCDDMALGTVQWNGRAWVYCSPELNCLALPAPLMMVIGQCNDGKLHACIVSTFLI